MNTTALEEVKPGNNRRYKLPSRDRLHVPIKNKERRHQNKLPEEQTERLISIDSDEDFMSIFESGTASRVPFDDVIEALRQDGFKLDIRSELEYPDLDLPPPRVITTQKSIIARFLCCNRWRYSCNAM